MVRETRYLIVRNLPESCSEETVIDHFQRYGKIQSVKLKAAKENGGTGTATVAFNDIKSAAKAHHANNSLGEATLRTDYWEGSTQTPVLVPSAPALGTASASGTGTSSTRGGAGPSTSYTNPPSSRPVSSFGSWNKGPSDEDGVQDKSESSAAAGGGNSASTNSLDKSVTAFDIPRGRGRDRFKKKFKFEKSGSFGRHGTSSRSLEAARTQSEAAAAAAAAASAAPSSAIATTTASTTIPSVIASPSSTAPTNSTVGVTSASISLANGPLSGSGGGLINHPVIVLTDGKDSFMSNNMNSTSAGLANSSSSVGSKDSSSYHKDSGSGRVRAGSPVNNRHSHGSRGRTGSSSLHRRSNRSSRSRSLGSRSRSRSRGSRSSSSRSDSSGTSRSTSPHRSFSSNTMRPQSMVGASRLVSSCTASDGRRAGDDTNISGDGERRSLGICVTGLPMRSSDSSLRDGLYHEYKKHGKVTTVQVFGEGDNRCAVVSFRKPEDASKALEASQGKTFFGAKIKVTSHEGVEVDDNDRASDNDSMDEYHQKSTRTLFVGNLEKETTTQDLIDKFKQFGEIIDVDIKRQGATTAFAFVQYVDISSVVSALKAMEGEHIGINKIKLGFGKSMPTCCVWLDNIPSDTSNRMLRNSMSRYGDITYAFVDCNRNKGLVCFSSYEDAQRCVNDIKQRPHFMKKKLQIDFASRECHTNFLDKMEKSGQMRAIDRPDESRVHKFRPQRSIDNFQDDGSPSSYGFSSNRSSSGVFNTPRSNGRSNTSNTRRSRGYDLNEENHSSSSRRSTRRSEDYNQTPFYKGEEDYDTELREYQRERRERDHSQSRRSSRDLSLDRYDDSRSKDRNTSSLHNSRDTSPSSEHNSYRYKYSSRSDRYGDDIKGDEKDVYDILPSHNHRSSRLGSPAYISNSSMHSHDSEYGGRRGSRAGSRSRSQSPDVTLLDDHSSRGMFYTATEDDMDQPFSSKSRFPALLSNSKLGAEVAKTAAEKGRKRTHEETNRLDKSSPLSSLEREKLRHLLGKQASGVISSKRRSGAGSANLGSPGAGSSGGSLGGGSENGSAGEDLHHLHQRKQILLMQIKELSDEDSPGLASAKGKSVAVKNALRHSGRSIPDEKVNEERISARMDKLRRSEARGIYGIDDKTPAYDEERSIGGNHSDSDYDTDRQRPKRRRIDGSRDSVSVRPKSYNGQDSVEVSDSEDHNTRPVGSTNESMSNCDIRSNSLSLKHSYEDVCNLVMDVSSPCDNGDVLKDSDKNIHVINKQQSSSKLGSSILSRKVWEHERRASQEGSPGGCFSPSLSEIGLEETGSVTSSSLTEKSLRQPGSPLWKLSPSSSPSVQDPDLSYLKDYAAAVSDRLDDDEEEDDDDCLSDSSIGKREPPGPGPGDASWEERIREIDRILNMAPAPTSKLGTTDFSLGGSSSSCSLASNKDISTACSGGGELSSSTNLYAKFRRRPREESDLHCVEGGVALPEQPSVIVQRVLSKKSILDQDFKRLEQVNNKYDTSSSISGAPQLLPPSSLSTSFARDEPQVSPRMLCVKQATPQVSTPSLMPAVSSSLNPVTTSSSVLQPTATTSVAGSTLALSSSSSSLLSQASSFAISATGSSMHAVTTSSVCTPISSISVSCENSGSKDSLDKHKNFVGSLNNSNFTNRLLPHHTSSSLSTPMTLSIVTTAQLISASSSSTSLSSVSVLSTSMVATCSSHNSGTSTSNTVASSPFSKQCNSSSSLPPSISLSSAPYVTAVSSQASLPLSSLSSTPSTSALASATAPITQDSASTSQLVPTLGQEAPIMTPREVPTPTALCPHLPGDQELPTPSHPPATSLSSGSSELTISLPSSSSLTQASADGNSSKMGKSSVLVSKSDVITPDIESPVSVKSGTSSTDSVPLSSLDTKIGCGSSETKSLTASDLARESDPSSVHIKEEPAVMTSIESEKGSKPHVEDVVKEILGPSKGNGTCPVVTSTEATVLSVSIKDNEHKDEKFSPAGLSATDKVTSFSPSSSSSNSVSTASDADAAGKPLLSSANFSPSVTPASSTVTSSNKSSLDKSDKKTPSKQSSKAASVSKTDSLFSPDVKLEPPQPKSSSSTFSGDKDKAQSKDAHKGSTQSSSSSSKPSGSSSAADKKSAKSSKDSRSDSVSGSTSNIKEGDKEKRPDSFHKLHDSASKGKESDKTKSKDKKEAAREGERSRKEKDEMKKKEEKKTAERKDEKKTSSQREEKKSEKKGDERKDKVHDKNSKQDPMKPSKSDPELSKKDKKGKEKSKENLAKDKSEKKLLPSLSCVAKNSTPEPKSSKSGDSKDSKSVGKPDSSKESGGKSESSSGKSEQKSSSKSESKQHKNDSKLGTKGSESKAEQKESSSSDKGKKSSSDTAQKLKKEGDKSGQENITKVKKDDDRSASEKSKKVSEGAHKSKRDGDKEASKPSKHSDKALKQKQKEEEKIKEKQRLKEKEEKEKREKEERERQKEKEREEREKQKEKERKEKEEKERKEREEKERLKLERERKEKEEKERREKEEKEKQRLEREKKDKEEKERKEKEEKERLRKEKEEREKQREKERQERERQKEKEREERERQKEKEEKERKEKEEREKLKKEREEKEKAKQKEREEKERLEKEKREKEEKERQRKEKEKKEKKEKEKKKAKEEKIKKEKEAKEKMEKEEKQKREKEEKGKKDKADKEKKDKEKSREKDDDKKKPPPPKKQKRNELAALLDSNDRFQMTFTSMYDRVKTQRNRESESGPNKSPSSATPRSSLDKFKQSRNKKGSKAKSSLYTYGSNSDLSDDDNMSETNESEDHSQKSESPRKEEKPKKTKQVKKRPHLSSSSSSSCEDDDDALLSVTKSKGGKKTDIFSSDSEDDSLPPPSVKSGKQTSKSKPKPPAPKKKKIRTDSLDSMGSRDEFVKPQTLSSVTETESFDDMDLSETEVLKVSKPKKKKEKIAERRDSSVESVTKNFSKVDRDSSSDSVTRKPLKAEKEQKPNKVSKDKKSKVDSKKAKQDSDELSFGEDSKMQEDSSKKSGHKDDVDLDAGSVKAEMEIDEENSKADIENLKSKDKINAESKSSEKKKKKDKKKDEDREDGLIKKKKKKKYDPKEEEALVNSLLTKMYDSKPDKEKKKKKPKQNIFDIESDDLSLSETSLDISHEKKPSAHAKEDVSGSKQKDKKQDKHEKERELQTDDKQESSIKHENKSKEIHSEKKSEQAEKKQDNFTKVLDKVEQNDKKQDHHFKRSESSDKKQHVGKDSSPTKEKLKSEENIKTELKSEQEPERSENGKPPKKKKKKDHEKDPEKDKKEKSNKSSKNILLSDKKSDGHKDDEKKSETKKDVDEFTSFWGHPKPILIPKRLKDSKKSEDETKGKDSKEEGKLDQTKQSEDAALQVKEEERSEEDKGIDSSPLKTPDSNATPKVESDTGDDIVVPISEAETTVVTENGQQTPSESASTSDSLMINEEQTPESDDLTGDMTTIGSSVEINDDEGSPSLVIDEVPDTSEKKKTKKEKRLVKEEKEKNDRLDEVIAKVAMGGSSDEEDGARQSPGVNLQDVIDEELKYDNKSSNEPDTPFIVSDFVFSEEKRKGDLDPSSLKDKADCKPPFESATKEEPEKKGFLLDEETKKKDEDLLKKLAVLCDPSADKLVEIEDPKAAEEARKKKEEEEKRKAEEEKRKAEEEKKKAEEEAKARREREEKEASDEAARAVESLLELQSEPYDDDLPPLFIEPADKEPPVESVSMSPSKDKSDVSIFPGSIPEKVTANLDDKLLERKPSDGSDTLGFFTAPSQSTHVPVFPSPRRNSVNSVGLAKDKTPEPGTMASPQRQMRSPQRQQMQQSPQLQSPQHRSLPSPQMVGPGHHSSPQKIQSPQAGAFIQSPQHQIHQSPTIPSPQRSSQSLQSPLLSPQRSPFFKQDRSFLSPVRDNFPQHEDGLVLAQQPQRRASSGLPTPPAPEHALDPHLARRKSQELPTEQAIHSPRRNTIATPDEAVTSVAHLDRRFPGSSPSGSTSGVFLSKERPHSSLPQPVSISLDNAPHDKNFQSPVRSLNMPPHQENALLSPKRGSPGFHHKEQHSLDPPTPFQLFQNKQPSSEQIFPNAPTQIFPPGQQHKPLSHPETILQSGKGLLLEKSFKPPTMGSTEPQNIFIANLNEKLSAPQTKEPPMFHYQKNEIIPFQKKELPQQQIGDAFTIPHNKPPVISQAQQEPMFSPKTQPSSPYTYPDVTYDFLNSPPPSKIGTGLGYPMTNSETSQSGVIKSTAPTSLSSDAFSHDPLFIAMSEASSRPPDKEPPPPRRQGGLPPSFYQEPVPTGPKFHQPQPELANVPHQFDDNKTGRKRKRSKKQPKEDKEAALKEQAIREIVQSNVEHIHQAFNATQAKAAAEKAGTKKAVDAYDFEAHTGQETAAATRPPISELHTGGITEDIAKPQRMRNEGRGRGRGRGGGRGRRGRGGGATINMGQVSSLQDKNQDPLQRPMHLLDPFGNQRRTGPDFPSQHQEQPQRPPPHQPEPRVGLPPAQYPPPVSHHSQFPPNIPPFVRPGGQQGFSQQFFPPQNVQPEPSTIGGHGMHDPPHKQQQQPVAAIPTSSPFLPHASPMVLSSSAASVGPPAAALPASSASTLSGITTQPQAMLQMPPASPQQPISVAHQKPVGIGDVLSPEASKQQTDLDSSFGESELVINLEDEPASTEGKENQCNLGSDSEEIGAPRNQRATRARRQQPNYKAIAQGTAQATTGPQGRNSRSAGSPRGVRGPPGSPKSSSPVVKLEKLEVPRTTRRGRKDDLNAPLEETNQDEDKFGEAPDIGNKPLPPSKESIYDFADNESDPQREPASLRATQPRRNKKRGLTSCTEGQDANLDLVPESPLTVHSQVKPVLLDNGSDKLVEESAGKSGLSTLLSNVDAVIEAVAKGQFGDEEGTPVVAGTTSNAEKDVTADPAISPPHTRASRRASEAKKDTNAEDQKQEKTTFSIAEAPRFEGPGTGKKGPTVPPLRIKVAHGTPKLEKEKHYVIASEHPQKPLSLTVKVAKSAEDDAGRDLGLFSGLPQGDALPGELKTGGPSAVVTTSPTLPSSQTIWKSAETKVVELSSSAAEDKPVLPVQSLVTTSRAGGALHPKVAAKVASQEAAAAVAAASKTGNSALIPSVGPHPSLLTSKSSPLASPAHIGPKQAWAAGHHLEQLQQQQHHQRLTSPGPHSRNMALPGINSELAGSVAGENQKHHQAPFGFPGTVPSAHGGSRSSFLLRPEAQGHGMVFAGKSPSQHGRTRTPPVTSAGMLYSGVVAGMPLSLSPKSASPEGQVIERLPNPVRQGEQSPSPLGLRLPGSHHPEPSRYIKGPAESPGCEPPPAHVEQRAPSREMSVYQHMMEQQRLQEHLLRAHAAAADGGRTSGPPPGAPGGRAGGFPPPGLPQPSEGSVGGRKGSVGSAGQPLNLVEQEPKSTPPASQSPFPPPHMSFMEQRANAGAGSAGKPGSAFMQPGHLAAQHLYPGEPPLGQHSHFPMMGRLPLDPRALYSPGGNGGPAGGPQQHMLREGLPSSAHFAPFQRSPSQSPNLARQLPPSDLVRLSVLGGHDLQARDSPGLGILQRYPVMWQGGLALKNESSYVQMHFIAGNRRLPSQALPQPMPNGVLPPLRISQRMRLEHTQLDGVAKRMQNEEDYCILIAVACGRDEHDISHQTRALNEGFITYLHSKQAAGIVNVPFPDSEQAGFVVHIFPPCDFVDSSVSQQGSEALMEQLRQIPHAVIIIATTFT